MDTKKIREIGNSVGLVFNKKLLDAVSSISAGDVVEIEYQKNKVIIRKVVG